MTDEEKKINPKAYITDGYLKVYEYKQAWSNLWETLSEQERQSFKELPNFDSDVFEFITGIRI
jgi:diacylglycerol kinase family enzyme